MDEEQKRQLHKWAMENLKIEIEISKDMSPKVKVSLYSIDPDTDERVLIDSDYEYIEIEQR